MQESGVPNVTGRFKAGENNSFAEGCFRMNDGHWSGGDGDRYVPIFDFSSNRSSNQYQSINEVRVKSIISNGYIKLY